jgi:hypothetical protein
MKMTLGIVKEASIEVFDPHSIFTMKQGLQANEPNTYVVPATTKGLETEKKRTAGKGPIGSSMTRGCARTRGIA